MTAKRRITESDDDDGGAGPRKGRTVQEEDPIDGITDEGGIRHSKRSGKGSGGRLAAMKQFERIQMEQPIRSLRIEIATQGEAVNPMAPTSQDIGERNYRAKRGGSGEGATSQIHAPSTSAQSSLQPEFFQATSGQQYGFRVPDSISQVEDDTRAPLRTRFHGVSSYSKSRGSDVPSSRSPSLFSGGSLGVGSTAPTSRPPSICSSTGERQTMAKRNPTYPTATSSALRTSESSASYKAPLRSNESSHNIYIPHDHQDTSELQIDEASPSEDDRIAEEALRQREDNEDVRSPWSSPGHSRDALALADDDDNDGATTYHHQRQMTANQHDMQSSSQIRSQAHSNNATMDCAHDSNLANIDVEAPQGRQGSRPPSNSTRNRPSVPSHAPESVVAIHRRRNRAPHLPDNSQLLSARQQQARSANNSTGDPEVLNNDNGRNRPSSSLLASTERFEPWQLQYYDPPARDVIERAKQFSHCDAASIDPFPVRSLFNAKVIEYIDEAITERSSRGLIISEGWWPEHATDITRLLWEDLGSWRSVLRKKARTFVTQRYTWDSENRRERNVEIAKNLLSNGGLFLRDGFDDEGRVNNLAHPALSVLIIDFFYTSSSSVGKLFPEVFAVEVPRVTVALAATAVKVVLDEIASGHGEVNFRVGTYSPVYKEILGLMSKCDTSAIHRTKTSALRKQWAELGSNGMSSEEQAVGGCGFDVCLD